jgi:hypothetical protein
MTSLSDNLSTTTDRARSGLQRLMQAVTDHVRPAPEPRAERAKREAREFLQQRREAITKAFESRTR